MASNQKQITDEFIVDLEQLMQLAQTEQKKDYLAGLLATIVARMFELDIDAMLSDITSGQRRRKLNGKVNFDELLNVHLFSTCQECRDNFSKNIECLNQSYLKAHNRSVIAQYDILIQRRHQFIHGNNTQATFQDLKTAYHDGEKLVECLRDTLRTHKTNWQQKPSLRKTLRNTWRKYFGKATKWWKHIW